MDEDRIICVFGDSTAWGAWDPEKGGWVNRLWLELAQRPDELYIELYNQSISGGTSTAILARFENEARARNANGLIFQTGGNDSAYADSPENNLVPIDTFRANIEEIIRRAGAITDNIAFLSIKNCDESKTMPVSWVNLNYANAKIEEYNRAMEEVCNQNGILFLKLDILNDEDFTDGLHPNAEGHEKIFRQVDELLKDNGWI